MSLTSEIDQWLWCTRSVSSRDKTPAQGEGAGTVVPCLPRSCCSVASADGKCCYTAASFSSPTEEFTGKGGAVPPALLPVGEAHQFLLVKGLGDLGVPLAESRQHRRRHALADGGPCNRV